jgi:hypothetical protein
MVEALSPQPCRLYTRVYPAGLLIAETESIALLQVPSWTERLGPLLPRLPRAEGNTTAPSLMTEVVSIATTGASSAPPVARLSIVIDEIPNCVHIGRVRGPIADPLGTKEFMLLIAA